MAGHTAILPTMQADKAALDELGDDERLVLTRVVRRMWEAVGDDYVHDVTNVVANIDPHWCEKHPDEGRLLPEANAVSPAVPTSPSPSLARLEHAAPQEDHGEEDEAAGNIIPANLAAGVSIAPVPHGGATLSEGKTKPPKPFTERLCSPRWNTRAAGWRTRISKPHWMTTNLIPEASARRPHAPT